MGGSQVWEEANYMVWLSPLHAWCSRTVDIILCRPDVNRSSPCWSWCWLSVDGVFQSLCSIFIPLSRISSPTESVGCALVHRRNLPSSFPRPNDLRRYDIPWHWFCTRLCDGRRIPARSPQLEMHDRPGCCSVHPARHLPLPVPRISPPTPVP
jgi:hypothetical protein